MANRGVVSGTVLIVWAMFLLLVPLQWVVAMVLAIIVHEMSHYLAIRLCGGSVRRISIGVGGIKMEVGELNGWQELICSLAGPVGGLALLFAVRWIPRTAVCGGFQALFNLLPIFPLDGGRAVRCLAGMILAPEKADRVCRVIETLCLFGIVCLGFFATFGLGLGLIPLGIAALVLQRLFAGKIPCKPGKFSVQ